MTENTFWFRLACRMLRECGVLNPLEKPQWRRSESAVDFMVRAGHAKTPQHAARALLVAHDLVDLHLELQSDEQIVTAFSQPKKDS